MNAKKKYLYIVITVIILLAAAYCLSGGSDTDSTSRLQADTDRAMAGIESEIKSAGGQITAGAGYADAAGNAIGRVDELLDRSESAAKNQSAGIAEVQDVIGECQKLSDEIRTIIRRADEEDGTGTQAGD